MANQWRRQTAQKRGGFAQHFSLEWGDGEQRYLREPQDNATPQRIFERRWALALLERAMARLRRQYEETGKTKLFDQLQGTLDGAGQHPPYADLAQQLEMTEGAVKTAAHRMRQRFREALRAETAQTVESAEQVEQELRDLFDALGR